MREICILYWIAWVIRRVDLSFTYFYFLGKMFKSIRVSSPAPVTIVMLSGFIARYTLTVWPVRIYIFSILDIFHILISFNDYPWVLTNLLTIFANIKLHTCDPTLRQLVSSPMTKLQKWWTVNPASFWDEETALMRRPSQCLDLCKKCSTNLKKNKIKKYILINTTETIELLF